MTPTSASWRACGIYSDAYLGVIITFCFIFVEESLMFWFYLETSYWDSVVLPTVPVTTNHINATPPSIQNEELFYLLNPPFPAYSFPSVPPLTPIYPYSSPSPYTREERVDCKGEALPTWSSHANGVEVLPGGLISQWHSLPHAGEWVRQTVREWRSYAGQRLSGRHIQNYHM